MPFSTSRHGFAEHQLAMFRRLDRLGPGPMLAALDRVGHETLQVWRGAIQGGVSAGGQILAALSPKYRKRKERGFSGRPILVRTGELLRSLAYSISEKKRFVYELKMGAMGPRAFTVLMQVTGTRRGAAARDFTRLPRTWWAMRLLAGLPPPPDSGT